MSSFKKEASIPRAAYQATAHCVLERAPLYILSAVTLGYAFLAGLRTVTDFDVFWQLASGRWITQYHRVPSIDVFSYTARGQPWIYPVGSGLLFYGVFLIGGYALLSWLGAITCVGTVALLLRRGSLVTATLAILAVPLIAARTMPRAEMFTVVLFAAFLSLLWQQHETGRARLWLLPLLMVAWVNLHLGFVAGVALLGGYGIVEALDLVWSSQRRAAACRMRHSWPWLLATFAATLANPWGWGVYRALFRQESSMATHSQSIGEWASVPLNWTAASAAFSLRNSAGAFFVLLLLVACAVSAALFQRQLGASLMLAGATFFGLRHMRLQGLFAVIVVVIAGAVFARLFVPMQSRITDARIRSIVIVVGTCLAMLLACVRSNDLVTNRTYLETTTTASFGTGLSWWFPEHATAFVLRENIPGKIFNDYNEGGFIVWRLGPTYPDYIDGRAIPFGPELLRHTNELMQSPPDGPLWQQESERHNINTIIVPLGRYDALQFFPVLPQFCSSESWRPVYLDEVSAVFVRRKPETEAIIQRSQVDCSTVPLPTISPVTSDTKAFNHWANAAAVLRVLGRNSEAFEATTKALATFPDSAFVHFTRGILLQQAGNLVEAEQQYLVSASLQPTAVAPWSTLASCYEQAAQPTLAINALERAAKLSVQPSGYLLQLGYAYLDLHRPQEALKAFDRAARSLPSRPETVVDNSFIGALARGRAISYGVLGDLPRAVLFEEEAVRWRPESLRDWLDLANLYRRMGRDRDEQRARERAAALTAR